MTEDLAAEITKQLAANAARESIPHRYEGIEAANIAARVRDVQADLQSWREANGVQVQEPSPDEQFREIPSEQAKAAYSLRSILAKAVAPLDPTGNPLTEPTADIETLIRWWSPGGPYADSWPGIVCGPASGYFGLMIWGDEGIPWYRGLATVHKPNRLEQIAAWIADPIDALGVPRPGGDPWGDDEGDQPKPDDIRPSMASPLMLEEMLPAFQPALQVWRGNIRSHDGQAAMLAAKGQRAAQMFGQVWSWPEGQTLPVGKTLRKGVRSLAAVPAFGAVLDFATANKWRVRHFPSQLEPPPSWLVDELQKF